MTHNPKQFLDRLKTMQGKTWNYAGKNYLLKDYKIDTVHEKVTIKTDSNVFEKKFDTVINFLDLWATSIDQPPVPTVNGSQVPITPPAVVDQLPDFLKEYNDSAKNLIDTLKDAIVQVKTNKDYIPQATAIKGAVDSIINIERMKLEVYRTYRKENPSLVK